MDVAGRTSVRGGTCSIEEGGFVIRECGSGELCSISGWRPAGGKYSRAAYDVDGGRKIVSRVHNGGGMGI